MWSVDTKKLEERGAWIWTSLSDHTLPIAKPTCRPQSNYWTVDMGNKASSSHRSATLMPEDDGSFLLVFEEGRLTRKQVLQALRSMQHVQRMTAVPEAATQSLFTYKIEISACVLESEAVNLLINSILIDLSPQWTLKSAQVALKEYDERQPLLRVNARQQNLLLSHVLQAMARYHTNMEVLSYSTTSRYTDPSGKALSHLLHKNHATLKQVGICTPSRRISDHFMVHLTRGLGIEDCSSTLQFLTLHSSQLTDHEFHELVLPALQKHTSLEALDLSRNPGLSAASLIPLTSLVQQEGALNLKALYLNHTNVLNDCQFSTELTPFMEALESNRTLVSLRLHSTGMDDVALEMLFARVLVRNTTLKRLDVSQNMNLTLDAVDLLIKAVPHWKGLSQLHFGSLLQATTTRVAWNKDLQATRLCQGAFQNTSMVDWQLELDNEWDWDHVLAFLAETTTCPNHARRCHNIICTLAACSGSFPYSSNQEL